MRDKRETKEERREKREERGEKRGCVAREAAHHGDSDALWAKFWPNSG